MTAFFFFLLVCFWLMSPMATVITVLFFLLVAALLLLRFSPTSPSNRVFFPHHHHIKNTPTPPGGAHKYDLCFFPSLFSPNHFQKKKKPYTLCCAETLRAAEKNEGVAMHGKKSSLPPASPSSPPGNVKTKMRCKAFAFSTK